MPTPPPSTTRAFVQWRERTVFAGEDVQCKITFKNLALPPGTVSKPAPPTPKLNGFAPGGERQRKTAPLQVTTHNKGSSWSTPLQSPRAQAPPNRGHRPTLSLNVPVSTGSGRTSPAAGRPGPSGNTTPGHRHRRSVSIISLGDDVGPEEARGGNMGPPPSGRRPVKNHARSASLQVLPKRSPMNPPGGPLSPMPPGARSATQPSPLFHTSTPQSPSDNPDPPAPSRRPRPTSAIFPSSRSPRPSHHQRNSSGALLQTFQFPAASTPPKSLPVRPQSLSVSTGTKSHEQLAPDSEHLTPLARVISGSSMNGGTPRSSGEFYSMSNNSTETLASDYVGQAANRTAPKSAHLRRGSSIAGKNHQRPPETLMMGYAQIMGSFTLDGALVNQVPFEEVKRKGVVGGQGGGGVVGVESKNDGGIFGGFGWGSIGESIGGLLGSGELSSIKEMRGIASSKSVPLLSTPQSILFVDLRLAPGESRTYNYNFTLPRDLPPTHRGKAIKISYNLVIGTQRAGNGKDGQQVRHVDIPFRVFGGVDPRGDVLTHDLLSPHIILRDQARTFSLDPRLSPSVSSWPTPPPPASSMPSPNPAQSSSSLHSFLTYIDTLLSHPSQSDPHSGLLSPTAQSPSTSRRASHAPLPDDPTMSTTSMKQLIDLSILRSNLPPPSSPLSPHPLHAPNRFAISRSSSPVATLLLPRPAYRLGDTLTLLLDFASAQTPTYSVALSLESSETVDASLALRSAPSIARVTRKIHARLEEQTLFARRIVWSPSIPSTGTPSFSTTNGGSDAGISGVWGIRVCFVTKRVPHARENGSGGGGGSGDASGQSTPTAQLERDERPEVRREPALLEVADSNECETILLAARHVDVESFEVVVPIRVYGAVVGGGGGGEGAGGEGAMESGKKRRAGGREDEMGEGLVV